MEFAQFVSYLEKLEKTSSQNAMIEILAGLFRDADKEEIDILCYFVLGEIAAGSRGITTDVGEKNAVSAIALGLSVGKTEVESRLREIGDLGDTTASFETPSRQLFRDLFSFTPPLTVRDVHRGLFQIANAAGEGSARVKIRTMASLIAGSSPRERRYLVRLATGQMRLGAGDMTLLDALATAFLGSKAKKSTLEQAYHLSSDIGYVAKMLVNKGLPGVERVQVSLHRPIHPMLSQRVSEISEILEKIGSATVAVEEKYDGERIQAHKEGDTVQLFSRRLTDVTLQFPDIVREVKEHVDAPSTILDGEAVAYDPKNRTYYPFQRLMQRRRKYRVSEYTTKIPVRYMVFDLLYLEGSSWMGKPYPERIDGLNRILESGDLIAPTGYVRTTTLEGIQEYFERCRNAGLEGVICKSCANDSFYKPGSRSWQWIKWKESYGSVLHDTLDLVAIGGYRGRGKRGKTYGSLLCAAYNEEKDVFQTVCGLGAGFTDDTLASFPKKFRDIEIREKPARCQVHPEKNPDTWFEPRYVMEVLGSEITRSSVHTCNWEDDSGTGMALRFPRFIRWRPEKSPEQATTAGEIAEMYGRQQKRS